MFDTGTVVIVSILKYPVKKGETSCAILKDSNTIILLVVSITKCWTVLHKVKVEILGNNWNWHCM